MNHVGTNVIDDYRNLKKERKKDCKSEKEM
jgi:hypothetical protein